MLLVVFIITLLLNPTIQYHIFVLKSERDGPGVYAKYGKVTGIIPISTALHFTFSVWFFGSFSTMLKIVCLKI